MPQTPHLEKHFTSGEFVRDVVIGMSDGLTVPFALAAGLSGAVPNTRLIVVGGLAEIAAGSIAMGLGGYLAARSDAEHYDQERLREQREVREVPEEEAREVSRVFHEYGLSPDESAPIVEALSKRPDLGRLHDALRIGTGRAGTKTRTDQRCHNRGCLRRRRFHPAIALRCARHRLACLDLVCSRHSRRPRDLRIHQGPLHWSQPSSQRITNNRDRCTCRRRGFRACKDDHLAATKSIFLDMEPVGVTIKST